MQGLQLDKGHRLALAIAVNNWRDVTGQLLIFLGHVMTDEPEAAELVDLLLPLQHRLDALRNDYAKDPG
jgi:hypothetical protein